MTAEPWLRPAAIYLAIPLALLAGLAASYGRELEAKRRPGRGWWARRLLILPLLAIAAATATELFDLSPVIAAFSAAMLSLGGYDVLRSIEAKWQQRIDALAAAAAALADPEPGP